MFSVWTIIVNIIGVVAGIIFGFLPGLSATMGVALLMPFTFNMAPVEGISLLLGVYCGGIYGGSITAILIRTPGTPASAATASADSKSSINKLHKCANCGRIAKQSPCEHCGT